MLCFGWLRGQLLFISGVVKGIPYFFMSYRQYQITEVRHGCVFVIKIWEFQAIMRQGFVFTIKTRAFQNELRQGCSPITKTRESQIIVRHWCF